MRPTSLCIPASQQALKGALCAPKPTRGRRCSVIHQRSLPFSASTPARYSVAVAASGGSNSGGNDNNGNKKTGGSDGEQWFNHGLKAFTQGLPLGMLLAVVLFISCHAFCSVLSDFVKYSVIEVLYHKKIGEQLASMQADIAVMKQCHIPDIKKDLKRLENRMEDVRSALAHPKRH